jgi:hypothetical protein
MTARHQARDVTASLILGLALQKQTDHPVASTLPLSARTRDAHPKGVTGPERHRGTVIIKMVEGLHKHSLTIFFSC